VKGCRAWSVTSTIDAFDYRACSAAWLWRDVEVGDVLALDVHGGKGRGAPEQLTPHRFRRNKKPKWKLHVVSGWELPARMVMVRNRRCDRGPDLWLSSECWYRAPRSTVCRTAKPLSGTATLFSFLLCWPAESVHSAVRPASDWRIRRWFCSVGRIRAEILMSFKRARDEQSNQPARDETAETER